MNRLILSLVLLLTLIGCSGSEWHGYVFPDKSNQLIHRDAGKFNTLEDCENASMAILETLNAVEDGYFECGNNCSSDSYYNRDCEKLVRGNLYH